MFNNKTRILLALRVEFIVGINQFKLLDIRRWQSYVEPGDESDTGSPSKRISRNMDQSFSERSNGVVEEELLPLPEDTLARNLGLDLIVVVAKVTKKYSFFN